MTRPFLDELTWRGLLYQHTDGAAEAITAGSVTGYCGFDPTADSLHVGSLVPIMGLMHLQRAGHRPVALVGGGTGLIGDPSGRSSERQLAEAAAIDANASGIRRQLERFLDFSGPFAAVMRNNAEWLVPLGAIDFLRDVGKHYSVNYMLAKDSVKSRLEEGISFTEFSYMLLQAYDFLELYRRDGVTLQLGGSDQWGNITAGAELVRRTAGAAVHGVTLPLVTRADGSKFGKSEAGNVWLDAGRTSPYRFYQFWINADDRDAGKYLRYFTLMAPDEIEGLEAALKDRPEEREAQAALAFDVTARVHGDDEARDARDVSRLLFDRKADPRAFSSSVIARLRDEIPFRRLAAVRDVSLGTGDDVQASVVDMLVETGLAKSRGDARRQLQQGAVTVNGRRLGADEQYVGATEAVAGSYFLIRKGARDIALVELT
ncbi:MAG TPA: tyrosine--tRNA ligase [Gemmatimonadaceae bacterium]